MSASHDRSHDGCVACIEDGTLRFAIEAEKDSGPRYARLTEEFVLRHLSKMRRLPDVLVQSGWDKEYLGLGEVADTAIQLFRPIRCWRTTHERAHVFGAYGMSPFPQGQPCYVLIWEGWIGSFYKIDAHVGIEYLGSPLTYPGRRYSALWSLVQAQVGNWREQGERDRHEQAIDVFERIKVGYRDGPGKLMALAAFAAPPGESEPDIAALVDLLLSLEIDRLLIHDSRERLADVLNLLDRWEPFRSATVDDQAFKNIVHRLTARLYDVFYQFARTHLREGLPLLIAGGCGLNCTWNTNWKECGLFPDIFVPPCANDSGIAIGAGIDAQHRFTGNAKLQWSVMAGEEFVVDVDLQDTPGFVRHALSYEILAQLLARGAVVGWVQGKYEIGPRALGHRSILAAPFDAAMHARLNRLKQRESYRPIAPICLEEDVDLHFHWSGPSPYMLHFQKLKSERLQAVTHVDGTARAQTVSERQDARMHGLLCEFKKQTGVGVLCNTSLNFKNRGFINRASDLLAFAEQTDVDALVINDDMLIKVEAVTMIPDGLTGTSTARKVSAAAF